MFYALEMPVSPSVTSTHGSLALFLFDKLREGEVTAAVFDLPCSNPHLQSAPLSLSLQVQLRKVRQYAFRVMLKKKSLPTSGSGTPAENYTFAKAPQPALTLHKYYI